MEDIKKDLFKNTMKGKWNEVVEIYRKHPEAHVFKITRTGETALHMAISENQEQRVKELIKLIVDQPNGKAALKIQNQKKNTPLHFAAAVGSVEMCKLIVQADSSLVSVRNSKGETPSFVAALQGKKEAFFYLHSICGSDLEYARRSDGDTILHCTIARDHFDLALQIIELYKERLANCVNQEGIFSLHLLASKPSAFKSGYQMGRWKTIIYNCIPIDELKGEPFDQQLKNEKNQNNEEDVNSQKGPNYKKIYTLCIEFLRNMIQAVICLGCKKKQDEENPEGAGHQGSHTPNFRFAKRAFELMLIVLVLGPTTVRKIKDEKQKHTWAVQIMNKLLELTSMYEDDNISGRSPQQETARAEYETRPYHFEEDRVRTSRNDFDSSYSNEDLPDPSQTKHRVGKGKNGKHSEKSNGDPTLLLATKYGIIEIVEEILKQFPAAKYDRNDDKKNIVLVAVENRQPHIYQLLQRKDMKTESLFWKSDKNGNSVLHLAAKLGDDKPWDIQGAALQMQCEFKWYELVRESMPPQFFPLINNHGETPKDVFRKTHKDLIKEANDWLTKTSKSCSVIAALIAAVAFATYSTVPGGIKEESGTPTLENQPALRVFAISSAVALCSSVMALTLFLGILTSQYEEKDFGKQLTRRLLIGLTSLSISIASVLTSFCAGDFFVLKGKMEYGVYPMFAATFFAVAQFRLHFKVMLATFRRVSKRNPRGLVLELGR